jgi:ribonuclease P protein component
LSRIVSLKSVDRFNQVKKEGRKTEKKSLEVFVLTNDISSSRLGIQISSKIANSVTRNKIGRRIKEAAKFLEEYTPVDVVVVVKREGLEADFFTIKDTLEKHPSLLKR